MSAAQMTLWAPKSARSSFVHAETMRLGAFLGDAGDLVGWSRTYHCQCGFHCPDPGGIWDHAQACAPSGGENETKEAPPAPAQTTGPKP